MLTGKNKELKKILKLRFEGKVSESSEKLADFISRKHNPENTIRAQIILASFTSGMDSWEKGLEIIERAVSESETLGDQLVLIDAFIVKTQCLLTSQHYKETILQVDETEKKLVEHLKPDDNDFKIRKAQEIANQGFTIAQTLNDSEMLFKYYQLLGICEFQTDEFEDAILHNQAGLQLAKDTKNDSMIASFSMKLAENCRGIGRFALAMEYLDISIEIFTKLGIPTPWLTYFKAIIYWNTGELEKVNPIFKEILPILEKETTHKEIGLVLMAKALIEQLEGDIDRAIEYMTEAVNLAKQMDDAFCVNIFSMFLTKVLFDKGEFDKVLEICFSILDTFKDNKKPVSLPKIYFEMGKVYHVKGDFNLALEYMQKALKLHERYNADHYVASTLFILLQISIDKNDKVLYTRYLEKLEVFTKNNPTILFEQMYQTAQALVLKTSSRPRDWAKAVEILIGVVSEKIIKYGHSEIALINLCELLMNEFSISGDAQVLQELEFYVEELNELATKQNVHHLKLETYNLEIITHWLKAQKSMVELDFQKAKTLLDDTRNIADEKGLYKLAEKLTQQQAKLLGQLSEWDDFIRKYYEFIKE